jgi:autophagy-related protein 33
MGFNSIASVKLVGVSSLGLLAGALSYQAYAGIPTLIRELSLHVNSLLQLNVIERALAAITSIRVASVTLGGLASAAFAVAFRASPPKGKHPYLIYAALGAPVALVSAYYKSHAYEARLIDRGAYLKRTRNSVPRASADEDVAILDDDSLGKSYIHVSDGDDSETPGTTPSGSPVAIDQLQHELSIEEEVENALHKKELSSELEHIRFGYYIGSAVTSVSFVIATIGLIGDYYLL